MKFILFVLLSTYSIGTGMTITSAEFNSKEACWKAADKIKEEFSSIGTQIPKTLCIEKGTP